MMRTALGTKLKAPEMMRTALCTKQEAPEMLQNALCMGKGAPGRGKRLFLNKKSAKR